MAVEDTLDIFGSDPFGHDYLYGLGDMGNRQGLAPYGFRYAENLSQPTTTKKSGYLGDVGGYVGDIGEPRSVMSELSASSEIGGRTVQYPLIVPTLTAQELNLLRSGGEPTQEIYDKAQSWAVSRLQQGQDPFANPVGLRYPQPEGFNPAPRAADRVQESPRGFTSGLFSDVLGGTLNMPSIPRTGIPALDLLYMNRNPLFNMMGVGDVQKTAERISYGQPLTTGSGMTLRPREEAVFAGMAVAPFVGEAVNLGARAGRAGARMVGERMAENVAMGRPNLPSMFAEPRSSLFAVEPSALMPKPQAPVSELGFYSAAEQAALNLPRNKGTGQSFLNDLMKAPDVKKDELSWIGLDDFLKDKPNVTKQEVQDFIASNKIDLQEVRLGEQFTEDPVGIAKRKAIFDKYEPEIQGLYKEMDNPRYRLVHRGMSAEEYNRGVVLQNRGFRGEPLTAQEQSELDDILRRLNGNTVKEFANADEARSVYLAMSPEEKFQHSIRPVKSSTELQQEINTLQNTRDIEADKAYAIPETKPTKYSKYQLAGGENYREILLKMPEKTRPVSLAEVNAERAKISDKLEPLTQTEYDALVQSGEVNQISIGGGKYQSSHFNEPNILAHMRVNDRVDADGKKMLLVEELQSDWHQAGREKGYTGKEAVSAKQEFDNFSNELAKKYDPQGNIHISETLGKMTPAESEKYYDLYTAFEKASTRVPDAPFKDTWYQLALKRVLKYAADNGYERVGLTTGKQQADRYKLSNEVDEINIVDRNYMTTGEKIKQVALDMKSGQSLKLGVNKDEIVIDVSDETIQNFMGKKLSEVVGKDIAKEIMTSNKKTISGEGLDIGGQGMKKYYDEIYPKFLEKYGKKWDASVGETKLTGTGSKDELAQKVYGRGETYKNLPSEQKRKIDEMFLQKGEPIRYIDITPKMKEGVKKGQPLAAAEQTPEMLASGGLDYADPFRNPLLESTIG